MNSENSILEAIYPTANTTSNKNDRYNRESGKVAKTNKNVNSNKNDSGSPEIKALSATK
jgi:hypothetical protein